ncbi:MAG: leucine-rich repeat protein [Christensenellales bacterium]
MEYIAEGSFNNCTSLTTLNLSNCYEIGEDAFNNCISVESLTLSTSLTTLGSFAFANCTSLKEVVIPNGVEGIDVASSFVGCTGLENFEIHNLDYDSFDGIVYSKDLSELVLFPAGKLLDTYKVLEQTIRIGDYAFASNKYLMNIDLTNVEEIGNNSFEKANVIAVKAANLKYVYPQAFRDATNLVKIDLNMIEELGFKAFANTGLEEVIMPNHLTYIEEQVFANCDNLRRVVISNDCCNFDYSNIFYQSYSY